MFNASWAGIVLISERLHPELGILDARVKFVSVFPYQEINHFDKTEKKLTTSTISGGHLTKKKKKGAAVLEVV